MNKLVEEGQVRTENGSGSDHGPTCSDNTLDGQFLTQVPNQMSDTVESVECKWVGHDSLGTYLQVGG